MFNLDGLRYRRYQLFIAGMGGLLYGIDIGIIAGALPYLESTAAVAWKLSAQQLGFVVAAVLLGSVLSSLFAGALADLIGRKMAMLLAGALFTVSIPLIALADGYNALLVGRLLQGVSGGLIGVVVPLYLAECLRADQRGRGTGIFQLLLTIGLVVAALIGLYQAQQVDAASAAAQAAGGQIEQAVFAARDHAWRSIFWMSLLPGLVFTLGGLLLSDSPRWLLRRGRSDAALAALRRGLPETQARAELLEIGHGSTEAATAVERDSLLSRRYVLPFLLACLVLACTQATGMNSILSYAVTILNAAGLPGSMGNWADVGIKVLNAVATVLAVVLVDRKGRRFLLKLGSGGIVISLLAVALLFQSAEKGQRDVGSLLIAQQSGEALEVKLDPDMWRALGAEPGAGAQLLTVAWSYGEFSNVQTLRSDALAGAVLRIRREDTVQPDSVIGAFFRKLHLNPFADPVASAKAPLRIDSARVGAVPDSTHGTWVAIAILAFVAFFAVGPGVCVWLALSELMPTRIRSNGMSVALLVNQFVSTSIAALFLPMVGQHGYAAMFFFWAGCTVVYFLTATFLLPETKGRTLEEIEDHFAGRRAATDRATS